jgi:hypothetical protein
MNIINTLLSNKFKKVKIQAETVQHNKNMKEPISRNKQSIKIDRIWNDETVYLIGGGPSLSEFNWNWLKGKKTIAINKAILTYPAADVLYWTDSRFYMWYKKEVDEFKGLKFTIRHHISYANDINIIKKGDRFGLDESGLSLCHGNNSGYAAINLAYILGAKKIILLGYDMKNDGVKGHYHDGYPVPVTGDLVYKEQFLPGFDTLAERLNKKGIKVYNASMYSELNVWPKITFNEALSIG